MMQISPHPAQISFPSSWESWLPRARTQPSPRTSSHPEMPGNPLPHFSHSQWLITLEHRSLGTLLLDVAMLNTIRSGVLWDGLQLSHLSAWLLPCPAALSSRGVCLENSSPKKSLGQETPSHTLIGSVTQETKSSPSTTHQHLNCNSSSSGGASALVCCLLQQ